jgi:ubiquinone/menaquinone biosynthesis C-methylase UbiE
MIAQNPKQQETWATGDFSMVGTGVTLVGELLCDTIPVHAGDRVLDIATGSGNTALAAARRGCRVTAVDFVPALLERGRERAYAERLEIDFQQGDAEALPLRDASFDVVLSTFGAMFAEPKRAASEMLRVCRPGGKIGMANWPPKGFVAEMFQIAASFAPPAADTESPLKWGIPDAVYERFGSAVSGIEFVPRHIVMRHHTPESWVKFFKTYFGPTIRAYAAAGDRAWELDAAMLDLAVRYNKSGGASLFVPADYIEVIATKA